LGDSNPLPSKIPTLYSSLSERQATIHKRPTENLSKQLYIWKKGTVQKLGEIIKKKVVFYWFCDEKVDLFVSRHRIDRFGNYIRFYYEVYNMKT
jgi:hypothetical protein